MFGNFGMPNGQPNPNGLGTNHIRGGRLANGLGGMPPNGLPVAALGMAQVATAATTSGPNVQSSTQTGPTLSTPRGFTELLSGVKLLLDSGSGSDLVLRCNDGKIFDVHKHIICTHSKFFRNACKPENFKEGQDHRIKLDIGASNIIDLLLNFCYTLRYDDSSFDNKLLANVQLYITADFYDISELKAIAAARFEECATVGALHSNQFPLAVELIYTIPAPTGRTLRDIALKVVTGIARLCLIRVFRMLLALPSAMLWGIS